MMKSEEIAKLAGVSRSTVSRVINNYTNVPEETREKVMKIIEQYGYEPNTSARVLAGKGTNTIGLFVVSIADKGNPNRIYQNNYFAPFVDAVVDTANALGYYVLIHTVYSREDYLKVKQAFLQKRVDSGIIIGTEKDTVTVMDIAQKGYPIAIIDYDMDEITRTNLNNSNLILINSMDYEGTIMAMNYLIQLGHREIGIITGRLNTYSGRQRYSAYEYVLREHGININKNYILRGDFLKRKAYQETKKLIQSGRLPTAIFVCNDDMALSAMDALKEEGIRIPEDISIVGFDDVPVVSQLKPALTTVKVPVYEMAKKAVEELIQGTDEGSMKFSSFSFPTLLIERETVKKF